MSKRGLPAACLLVFLGASSLQASGFRPKLNGVVSREFVDVRGSDRAVEFVLYLPPSYATSETRYPVIYHLHGLSTRGRSATLDGMESSMNLLAEKLEEAVSAGVVPEVILVAPYDGVGFSMWSDSKDGRVHAESDLVDTLVPHVDGAYRTHADRKRRVVQGFSMGGYGAVKNAMKFPQHFSIAVNYDGALHDWSTLTGNRAQIVKRVFSDSAEYFDRYSPWTRYEDLGPWGMRIKSNVGLLEAYNEKLKAHLESLDLVHDYVQTACGHDFECLLEHAGVETFRFIGETVVSPDEK